MKDKQFLSILAVMVASFALSFAYLYLHGRPEAPVATSSPPHAAIAVNEPAAPPVPPAPAAAADPAVPAVLVPEEMPAGLPPAMTAAELRARKQRIRDEAPLPMPDRKPAALEPAPVLLVVLNPGEVTLHNQRETSLSLTVTEVQSSGEKIQIQVSIAGNQKRKLRADDGLLMQTGDRLIVHADGFADRESVLL